MEELTAAVAALMKVNAEESKLLALSNAPIVGNDIESMDTDALVDLVAPFFAESLSDDALHRFIESASPKDIGEGAGDA